MTGDAQDYVSAQVDLAIKALDRTLDTKDRRDAVRGYMKHYVVEPVTAQLVEIAQENETLRAAITDAVEAAAVDDDDDDDRTPGHAYASMRHSVRMLMLSCQEDASTTMSANAELTYRDLAKRLSWILESHP